METVVESDRGSVELPSLSGRIGTDAKLLNREINLKVKTKGRPQVNREIAYQLLKAGYSTRYIRKVLKCGSRTIRRIKKEMKDNGDLEYREPTLELEKIALEFDDECIRAVGISFHECLTSKMSKKYANAVFGFSKKVWESVWSKPSLILIKDAQNLLGDQITLQFIRTFGGDLKRIRRRKKMIRHFFRFLGRMDLCDRYLTMSRARDPEEIREIPELTLLDFPEKLEKGIRMVGERLGSEYELALKFKIVTQMRTGETERELLGITVGEPNGSWIIFSNRDQFRGEIIAKGRERWLLEWLPRDVRHDIYRVYQTRKKGDKLFKLDVKRLRKVFKEATEKVGLTPMKLHDLRKVSVTWFWTMGIDLSIATELNVGWKDLNTAKKHYLRMTELLRKSDRLAYRNSIPSWFKDGLEEYLPF